MISKQVKEQLNQMKKALEIYEQVKQTPSFTHGLSKEVIKKFPDIYYCSLPNKNQPNHVFFADDEKLLEMVHGTFDYVVHLYENNKLTKEEVESINVYYEKWYGEPFDIDKKYN